VVYNNSKEMRKFPFPCKYKFSFVGINWQTDLVTPCLYSMEVPMHEPWNIVGESNGLHFMNYFTSTYQCTGYKIAKSEPWCLCWCFGRSWRLLWTLLWTQSINQKIKMIHLLA
jgi:hypothetical protein